MSNRFVCLFFFCCSIHFSFGQAFIHIQGVVRNAYNRTVLDQAQVTLINDQQITYTATTDTSGMFRFIEVIPGRYTIKITAKGYQSQSIKDYLLGRTNIPLLFELVSLSTDLPEVVISDRKNGIFIHPLSNALEVTREETERLPAGFFDPARLFTNQAGISSMNDGANHLIIRGNNPLFVKWMIHGTEILNPNHLSNAGTFSDQASPSGGGVNMISASVLENTYLYKNPYPATIGNSLAGAIDLNLRNGSTDKLSTEAQISFLGMEIGIEGPLSKKGASFVARYRYSTVGLLSQFGLKFGDENINYQDVMVHASLPLKKGDLSLFLFTGYNMNDYAGKKDSADRIIDKESSDISFKGGQLLTGLLFESKGNSKGRLLTDLIYSQNKTTRSSSLVDRPLFNTASINNFEKINLHSRWVALLGANKIWTNGFQFQVNKDNNTRFMNGLPIGFDQKHKAYTTLQPYSNYLMDIGRFSFQGGIHSMIYKKGASLEPRVQLSFNKNSKKTIQLDLGKYTQTYHTNQDDWLMKSLQAQLSYQFSSEKIQWRLEGYIQHHYNIPGSSDNYSLINESPNAGSFTPVENTKGEVYGMESGLTGVLGKWKYHVNLAVFHSTFSNNNINQFSSRFDQKYLVHTSIGREWEKQKTKYKKLFGWYSAVQAGGAMRDSPIAFNGQVATYPSNGLYTLTRPGLYRIDTRIYRRKFYKNLNTLLALDIQNISGQQNFAFSYFDYTKKAVTVNYQLGILPNLSFTIEY
ncbi:MAG: carboxypeptidase-like regulatory domain-containing protein [Saprospiraceae bacterium]